MAETLPLSSQKKTETSEKIRFHFSLLVVAGGLILTFLLWDSYFNNASDIEKKVAGPLILVMGSLFSMAAGLFAWSLETRDQFLRREVQKRTLELQAKNEELTDKNQEIENFIHIISHDLKAPLVSIHGFGSLLKSESENALQGASADYLKRILMNAKQMTGLLQDLLEFSRVGRMEDEKEAVDMNLLFREILAELKPEIDRKKIQIESPGNFPSFWGSRKRLYQVFTNLIGNSVKYIGKAESPKIVLSGKEENADFFQISVRDNGIGIPKESQHKVFQIFQRFHPASGVEGTGVGLSIVKKIVEHNKGRVWFESEPGKGTVFHVAWPQVGNG